LIAEVLGFLSWLSLQHYTRLISNQVIYLGVTKTKTTSCTICWRWHAHRVDY
ncbi:hypothetical protein COCMIDRAFT_96881, partial [Bipolaris oryzae ATCC 44560]